MPNTLTFNEIQTCGVYLISDHLGRYYIGSSVNVKRRWEIHRTQLRTGKHGNVKLQRAWNKYGEGCFTFRVIELCSEENLVKEEQAYLDMFTPHYNICKIAGSCRGVVRSEETRRKMGEAKVGNTHGAGKRSEAAKANIKAGAEKRPPISEETREKQRQAKLGNKNRLGGKKYMEN